LRPQGTRWSLRGGRNDGRRWIPHAWHRSRHQRVSISLRLLSPSTAIYRTGSLKYCQVTSWRNGHRPLPFFLAVHLGSRHVLPFRSAFRPALNVRVVSATLHKHGIFAIVKSVRSFLTTRRSKNLPAECLISFSAKFSARVLIIVG